MESSRNRHPSCGFCDGTGLWVEQIGDPPGADPCPLCEGTGVAPPMAAAGADEAAEVQATFTRLVAVLPRLSQAERQRLYEELHARWDCRIYKP